MSISFAGQSGRLELSAFRPSGGGYTIVHASEREAYQYLKARAGGPLSADSLRQLLARQGARNLSGDDDAVWREAASRLVSGQLYLVEKQQTGSNGIVDAAEPPPAAERPRRPAMSPPPPLPPPRKQAAQEAAAAAPEQTAFIEQDVQAASLEQAAASGTPFCEVCEKARREREAAQAEQAA